MAIPLEAVTQDSDTSMVCAGYMHIASFSSREEFEDSEFSPIASGPFRATDTDAFDVWANDPRYIDGEQELFGTRTT